MLESVNLEWIKSFVAFAECGGVEEAAVKIGITQPAVSQHLSKLEFALGMALFERHGKRKTLSPTGTDVFLKLNRHMRDMDESLRNSKHEKSKESDITIRLGLNRDIFYRICDKLEFEGHLEFSNQRSTAAIKALLNRELDIAVGRVAPDSPDVVAVKWFADTFAIAYPKSWQKQISKANPLADLQRRHFILNLESKSVLEEVFLSVNINISDLDIKRSVGDWLSILKLVESGEGWAIVPSSFAGQTGIVYSAIAAKDLPRTQFYILYHRSIRKFEGVEKLIASIKNSMT